MQLCPQYLHHASAQGIQSETGLTLEGNVCLEPLLTVCGAFMYMHIYITKPTSQLGLIDPVGGSPRREA